MSNQDNVKGANRRPAASGVSRVGSGGSAAAAVGGSSSAASASAGQGKGGQPRPKKRPHIAWRIIRWLLVPVLCVGALIAGLIAGYVYIGGEELQDVWKWKTWKHVFDLMFAET